MGEFPALLTMDSPIDFPIKLLRFPWASPGSGRRVPPPLPALQLKIQNFTNSFMRLKSNRNYESADMMESSGKANSSSHWTLRQQVSARARGSSKQDNKIL